MSIDSPTLFENRNVLDRIETTWKLLILRNWKVALIPPVIIGLVGGILSLIIMLVMGISTIATKVSHAPSFKTDIIVSILGGIGTILIVWMIAGGLIYTYTISFCEAYTDTSRWQDLMRVAWGRLSGWMGFTCWYIITLVVMVVLSSIGYFGVNVLINGTGWVVLVIGGAICLWASIAYGANMPGYILQNTWSPVVFFRGGRITHQRWWRVFGNMILIGIILNSALGVVQQIFTSLIGISIVDIFGSGSGGVDGSLGIGALMHTSIFSAFFSIIGGVGLLCIYQLQQIFTIAFGYVVWKDIHTPIIAPSTSSPQQE